MKGLKLPKYGNTLFIYRLLSWFLTSFFYLFGDPHSSPNLFKAVVIALILFSAILTGWLYKKTKTRTQQVKILLLIETTGISLLLIPTGVLDSPFIWYALNPVLIAASVLPVFFSWIVLLFYFLSTAIMAFITSSGNSLGLNLFNEHSYLILVFILTTVAVQISSYVVKELNLRNALLEKQQNELKLINYQLRQADECNQETLEHLMSLYQFIEGITSLDNRESLIKTLSEYAKQLNKSESSFFWLAPNSTNREQITIITREKENNFLNEFKGEISNLWYINKFHNNPTVIKILNKMYLTILVASSTEKYGVIGIELPNVDLSNEKYYEKQLIFLSKLSSIIFERFTQEEINYKLLLLEEQNRIANEIHDSVSQRLFSIVYGIHSIKKIQSVGEIINQVEMIEDCAIKASQELRDCIYRLSSKKNKENNFISNLSNYLLQISKLNNVVIKYDVTGEIEKMPIDKKQMVFRIIFESVGNAIRHGKAKEINIKLNMEKERTYILIIDNGCGFDIHQKDHKNGLGLENMEDMIRISRGKFQMESNIGQGTKIVIKLPHQICNRIQEGIA